MSEATETGAAGITRRVRFRVGLTHSVLGLIERTGWLLLGAHGWAEWSPLPGWSRAEAIRAYRGAVEAAMRPAPAALQDSVPVNAMIPRVEPGEAERMAAASPCRTIKVKVGDPDGVDRVHAVRSAAGPSVKIRIDANGAWDVETAITMLQRLSPLGIELAEDPVAGLDGLARVRRRCGIPIAAEMAIRTIDDADPAALLGAADALVIKPQRIGGPALALEVASRVALPVIISSALETSVGLSTALSVAAALPPSPYAHGLGTALLLDGDVTRSSLIPADGGRLRPRTVVPDLLLDGAGSR